VRYRASSAYGGPLESITWGKQKRIRNAARYFLLCHKQYKDLSCRFDVLGVETDAIGKTAIHWVRSAFC
jgi:putative endonuclease